MRTLSIRLLTVALLASPVTMIALPLDQAAGANSRVLEVPVRGVQRTLAFTAPCGFAVCTVSSPHGVATDSSSNVYIADTNNNRVLQLPW